MIAVVQTATPAYTDSSTSIHVVFPSAVTAGNAVIVTLGGYLQGLATSFAAPTDNASPASNTYHQAVNVSNAGDLVQAIWFAYDVTGGFSTVTDASLPVLCCCGPQNSRVQMTAYEISGLTITNPLDVSASNFSSSNSTPSTGTTAVTSQANELAVAAGNGVGFMVWVTPTGYSHGSFFDQGSGTSTGESALEVLSSVGAQSATWGQTNTGWSACIATFEGAAAAPAGPPPMVYGIQVQQRR
jgi:hypothetical protein